VLENQHSSISSWEANKRSLHKTTLGAHLLLKEHKSTLKVITQAFILLILKEQTTLISLKKFRNYHKNPDNNAVLQSVFYKFLTDKKNFPTEINGIIYLHDSNNFARCHYEVRCKHLALIAGDKI
jgi:hypothetical protein